MCVNEMFRSIESNRIESNQVGSLIVIRNKCINLSAVTQRAYDLTREETRARCSISERVTREGGSEVGILKAGEGGCSNERLRARGT